MPLNKRQWNNFIVKLVNKYENYETKVKIKYQKEKNAKI